MDLLDRYLQAVRFFLPKRQQNDIIRELSEDLVSEMEDEEAARGRPLTQDEQADILRRRGHPMLVAGKYRTHQRLIGPAFFPIYAFALEMALGVSLLVTVLLAGVGAVLTGDPVGHFVRGLLEWPARGLAVFAWTTLGFAALDHVQSRMKIRYTWDPRTLPRAVRREHWTSRARAVFELVLIAACLVWLLLLPGSPELLLGQGARILAVAPVWHAMYVPIVLLTAAAAALRVVDVVRPYWTPARSAARIAVQAAGIVMVGQLLRAGEWVVAVPGASLPGGRSLDRLLDVVNRSVQIGLFIAAVVSLFEIGREINRLRLHKRAAAPPDSAEARASR
jgi:hypothetical protein